MIRLDSRLPLLLLVIALGLLAAGCGRDSSVLDQTTPTAAPGKAEPGTPRRFADSAPLQVRMAPQDVQTPPFALRGVVPAQPASGSSRHASFDASGLSRSASSFTDGQLVSIDGAGASFAPSFSPGAGLSGLAYCSYSFQIDDYAASGQDQTLALDWDPAQAPADYANLWIGLANWSSGRWDWFAGPADGVLTVDGFTPYTSGSGELRAVVALMGSSPARLRLLRVGGAELRGTGAVDEAPPVSSFPPLADGGSLPASVDLTPGCPPVRDQGAAASCTAFAIADGAFNYQLHETYGAQGWDYANPLNLVSPKFMYLKSGELQGFACPEEGRLLSGCAQCLQDYGIATEQNAPYADLCDDAWTPEALDDSSKLKIEGYSGMAFDSPDNLHTLKTYLANLQRPVVLATRIDDVFRYYSAGSVWNYSGPAIGSHAMLIVGYDDAKQAFKLRNSWGGDWGEGGYLWAGYGNFDGTVDSNSWGLVLDDEFDGTISQEYCGTGPAIDPPADFNASDGDFADHIALSWTAVSGATGYKISRDYLANIITTINDGAAANYDDYTVSDSLTHIYFIRAFDATDESTTASDLGYESGALPSAPLITVPASGPDSTSLLQVFYANPKIRTDDDVIIDPFQGSVTPADSTAFGDELKDGDEFAIQWKTPGGLYPLPVMVDGSDWENIAVDDANAILGIICVINSCSPGRLVLDIGALPATGGQDRQYAYRLFDKNDAGVGGGLYTEVDSYAGVPSLSGVDWGINAYSRSGQLDLADADYSDKSVEGSTVGSATPDVLFMRFNGGYVYDTNSSNIVYMYVNDSVSGLNGLLKGELRAAGISSGGEYLMIHTITASDFFGSGGCLVTGGNYDTFLDYTGNPDPAYYFGAGNQLTVSSAP